MEYIIPLIIAFVYSIFVYYVTKIITRIKHLHKLFINVTTGLMFAYMFLTLLPDVYFYNTEGFLMVTIFFIFAGYISFYIAEKQVYAKKLSYKLTHREVIAIKSGGFYLLHFITGFIIVYTFSTSTIYATLILLIPFTFHILATSLLYEDINKWSVSSWAEVLQSFLILVGALSAVLLTWFLGVSLFYFYAFFAGTFMYLVTTIVTPEYKHGNVTFFLLGIFLYLGLLLI